jgi:hypothetical protein
MYNGVWSREVILMLNSSGEALRRVVFCYIVDRERPVAFAGTVLANLFKICSFDGVGSKLDSYFLMPKNLRIGDGS